MLRRGIAPATLVLAVMLVGWLVTGVAVFDIVRFLAYDIGFVALPGAALLWAVRGHRSGFLVTIALGWPLGQALEILAFSGTAAIGNRALFLLYPIVVIVPSAIVTWRRRQHVDTEPAGNSLSIAAMWTAAGAVSVGLVYLTLMFLPLAPLPGASVMVEYPDYTYFIGLIAQVMHHWPPTTPGLVGVPLHYEWFVLFHIAAASQVTNVPIPVIGLRLDYIPTVVVLACQLLVVGRSLGRSWWTGAVAVVIIFLLGPLDLSSTYTSFGDNVFVHLWDSWTFPYGVTFFLALLYLITERFRASTWRTGRDLGSWVLIGILMIGASGAKATVLPILIAGTGLYVVLDALVRRAVSRRAVVTVALAIVVFIPTYVLVYGGSTPATTIDPLVWLSGGPAVLYANLIHHAAVRDVVLPFAYAANFAGVMLPLAGMFYLLRRRHRSEIPRFALPLCLFATGVAIASLVHHSSYSELYFVDTGYMAGCFVAAHGYRLAWLDLGHSQRFSRRQAVIAVAGWLVLFLLIVKITSHSVPTIHDLIYRFAAITALGVVFVLAWGLWLRARHQSHRGIAALGLLPILAATSLTLPLLAYPQARSVLAGKPVATGRTVLSPGLVTALDWLKTHTSVDAVFAVNNHWLDPMETQPKYYYYTAFSERQAFIESYNPYPIPAGTGTPAGADFVYRQHINDAVFDSADTAALRVMTQQYSVRYLLIDRSLGSQSAGVLRLGHIVFSNQSAIIIAVG
ncbi:MAG TPA: hypothetical protein VMU65_12295 [Candidatus Saccharimonadales bacterium]|nr:hypothetical protein [Candidatus Saccharimonadales bacterium]